MPSNITPKDFKPLLPEERDTIAQGLLKYVKFAILFWRWYRDAHATLTEGDMSNEFLRGICETGCLGGELVVEGVANENPTQDELEGTDDDTVVNGETPGGKLPEDTNTWTINPDLTPLPPMGIGHPPNSSTCCDFAKDHNFFFWGSPTGANLMCLNGVKVAGIRNGVPGGVSFSTKGSSNFRDFAAWKFWRGATGKKLFRSTVGGTDEVWTAQQAMAVFDRLEIFIYGVTPLLRNQNFETPPLKGGVFYNDGTAFQPFKVKNNGLFGAQIILENMIPQGTDPLGKLLRDLEIHFSNFHTKEISENEEDQNPAAGRVVRNTGNSKDKWPLQISVGGTLVKQPYLAYVAGIRLVILHQSQSLGTFDYPVSIGGTADALQILLDDRWQNEHPCYMPTEIESLWTGRRPEGIAPLWTTDGHKGGIYEIYPTDYVNTWPMTNHKYDWSIWSGKDD